MFYILLITAMLIVGPFLSIWALNTLFMLSIPFTFKTWIATFIISGVWGIRK